MWRDSLRLKWKWGYVLADSMNDAKRLVKELIDFEYKEAALELRLERKLTMDDLIEYKQELIK